MTGPPLRATSRAVCYGERTDWVTTSVGHPPVCRRCRGGRNAGFVYHIKRLLFVTGRSHTRAVSSSDDERSCQATAGKRTEMWRIKHQNSPHSTERNAEQIVCLSCLAVYMCCVQTNAMETNLASGKHITRHSAESNGHSSPEKNSHSVVPATRGIPGALR